MEEKKEEKSSTIVKESDDIGEKILQLIEEDQQNKNITKIDRSQVKKKNSKREIGFKKEEKKEIR